MSLLSRVYREGIALDDRAGLLRNGTYSRTVLYSILYPKVHGWLIERYRRQITVHRPQNTRASIDISQYLVPRTVLAVMACLMSAMSSAVNSTSPAAQFSIVRLALLFG
jgi:hypothetical protein